jgi:hypothetical protein
MSWTILPGLLLCVGFLVSIGPARHHDAHLLCRPGSGCVECEGK